MFDNLRDAFRQAVENFKTELHRDEVPESVDRLLHAMREEIVDAQAAVRRLEEDIRKALRQAEKEGKDAATCRRRAEMAEKIGDDETARIAREYADKHDGRRQVLEKKALALREEMEMRRSEVAEMMKQIEEARQSRNALAAKVGRAGARESIRRGDDLFAELDRMAERIGDDERRTAAEAEVADELSDEPLYADEAPDEPLDLDARLEELKRKMGG